MVRVLYETASAPLINLLAVLFSEHMASNQLFLCCTTHLSRTHTFRCVPVDDQPTDAKLSITHAGISAHGKQIRPLRGYRQNVTGYQSRYEANHQIYNRSFAKTWGLVSSPLGQWIVGCFSLHPADMVEYIMPGEEKSTLTFSRQPSRRNWSLEDEEGSEIARSGWPYLYEDDQYMVANCENSEPGRTPV